MTVLVGIIAPVFGIMALGALIVKLRILDGNHVRGLVLFVFNVAIPVLLFRSLAQTQLPPQVPWSFILSYYGGSFAVYALAFWAGRALFRRPLAHRAIFGMSGAFSNTVLVGIPVLLTAFGPEATLPIFLIIAFHGPTLMPLTAGIIQVDQGEGVAWSRQAWNVVGELVRNPIIMGLLLGLLTNLSGWALPGPLDRMAELLGSSAVPCALFALGASLAGYPLGGDLRPSLLLVPLKLLLHPLLVWTLAVPVFGLEGIWAAVAVSMAAMPTGINAYLFGARYQAATEVAAKTVLLSTLGSILTLSVVLSLFT